ncbi:hypothetical protein CX649_07150 [Bacillaceae bacterium ZC4]|jgi:hypothetical protein|nr:hypothetical protein CX649_07150 [Bacillaceae bacterium ZC4]BBU38814.1 hypothetical protein APP_11060 [Aeribacillus pallidus]
MHFDEHGNLNGGIIKGLTMEDVEKYFVKEFPDSNTRKRNFEGFQHFLNFLESIHVIQKVSKIWLDGSFLTNKNDPNDIDMVLYLNPRQDYLPFVNEFLKNCADKIHTIGRQFYCDAYFSVDDSLIPTEHHEAKRHFDYQRKYWMGQFGFDRQERSKGIIEISLL